MGGFGAEGCPLLFRVMKDPKTYDLLMVIALLVGIHEGVEPFAAKIFGWHPFLSLPLNLASPAWWIVSGLVIVVAVAVLLLLDAAKRRNTDADE
jgi:branched-subunit amino acid permease